MEATLFKGTKYTNQRVDNETQCHQTSDKPEGNAMRKGIWFPQAKMPYYCKCCGQGFVKWKRLNAHVREDHSDGFPCKICYDVLSSIKALNKHMEVHSADRPFACNLCNKRFYEKRQLEIHVNSRCSEITKCSICDKIFTSPARKQAHEQTHNKQDPYACSICNKGYSNRYYLLKHMREHNTTHRFICDICGKPFTTSELLRLHNETHTDTILHMCNICNEQFTKLSDLNAHFKTHSNSAGYFCNFCGLRFKRKIFLDRHKQIHAKSSNVSDEGLLKI